MKTGFFYVRIVYDRIPEGHAMRERFREDRNYPVLAVDAPGNRLLIHDDAHKLLWVPMQVFNFVKLG